VLAYLGLALLLYRMGPLLRRRPPDRPDPDRGASPLVSILIPARNEARRLPALLESLRHLRYPSYEVIVIDDDSEDRTREIARTYGARVVAVPPRPHGRAGKNWACLHGARAARGDYLLFTDADTVHLPDGLERVIRFMRETRADLVSALPYHRGESFWERGLGLFHLVLLAVTAPFQPPRPGRVFAIGQYLLFRTGAYWAIGGHEAVRETLSEDIGLATIVMQRGAAYRVFPGTRVFAVRMYESFPEFIRGWRRNFRLGLGEARPSAPLEVALLFAAFVGSGPWSWPAVAAAVCLLLLAQRRLGNFSWTSVPLIPVSIVLFTWITILAVADRLLRRDVRWKGRSYSAARVVRG
jgi:hypothetical protein